MEIIDFEVGGRYYATTLTTLQQIPDNLLLKLATNNIPTAKRNGRIFIDRDGSLFGYILDYLRFPSLWKLPTIKIKDKLKIEAEYYCLFDLVELIDNGLPQTVIMRIFYTQGRIGILITDPDLSGKMDLNDIQIDTLDKCDKVVKNYIRFLNNNGYTLKSTDSFVDGNRTIKEHYFELS